MVLHLRRKLKKKLKTLNTFYKMKITIDTHHCSREELESLKSYLNKESWDFTTDEPKEEEEEAKYILSENGILIVGSHGITLNEKIRDEDLHEYYIEEKSNIIDNLIMWISECSRERAGDKTLMQDDLEMIMARDDNYFFSSNATNSYIFPDDSEFNKTCEELIELNETL